MIPMTSTTYEQVEPGTYPARLVRVCDLGDQESTFSGETNTQRKVLLGFELINERMSDGRPFLASRTYTASLHKMAALRRDLEGWFGRPITREDEKSFDLHSLLGKPAMVTVTETESGKRKISGISGPVRGMEVPAAETPELYFSLDPMEFKEDILEEVPEFWRELIKTSAQYRMLEEAKEYRLSLVPDPAASTDDFPWD
jgi:hypothetical protein